MNAQLDKKAEFSKEAKYEVLTHFQIQRCFQQFMKAAQAQLGFNPNIVGSRMMLMSRPSESILIFKDYVTRRSLIFDTESSTVHFPRSTSFEWDSLSEEFSQEDDATTMRASVDEVIRLEIRRNPWYQRSASTLIELMQSDCQHRPVSDVISHIKTILHYNCLESEYKALSTALSISVPDININQICLLVYNTLIDDLNAIERTSVHKHPLYSKCIASAYEYLEAADEATLITSKRKLLELSMQLSSLLFDNSSERLFDIIINEAKSKQVNNI